MPRARFFPAHLYCLIMRHPVGHIIFKRRSAAFRRKLLFCTYDFCIVRVRQIQHLPNLRGAYLTHIFAAIIIEYFPQLKEAFS